MTATALVAAVGDRSSFKNGRQFAAWLGLVPKQRSSGGRARFFGISKRGDRYLRTLLIHGARSALGRVPPAAQCRRSRRMVVRSVGSNKSFVSSFPFFPVDLPVGKVERRSVEWSRATSRPDWSSNSRCDGVLDPRRRVPEKSLASCAAQALKHNFANALSPRHAPISRPARCR